MNAIEEQKRADVRGDISFVVNFKVITPEEYEASKNDVEHIPFATHKKLKIDVSETDNHNAIAPDPQMVEFLARMDEKLDLILAMLSEKNIHREIFEQGQGMNISGSGLRLTVDRPVDQPIELGQILDMDFKLSRIPCIPIHLFGKVIRITSQKKDKGVTYNLGIHFLELYDCTREQIFSQIFQLQREALRRERQNQ